MNASAAAQATTQLARDVVLRGGGGDAADTRRPLGRRGAVGTAPPALSSPSGRLSLRGVGGLGKAEVA